jgi:DNA-binding response OmpR family regulator
MDTTAAKVKIKMLIVEDEVPLATAMKDQFEREGYQVVTAGNGEDGLEMATSDHPDVIILDILMPKSSGLDMLHRLREQDEYGKNVKVVILTNLDTSDAILKDVVETLPTFYLIKADTTMQGLSDKVKEALATQVNATTV